MNDNILPVDFTKPKRQAYQHLGDGLYYIDTTKPGPNGKPVTTRTFYCRPYVDGRQTWRKLNSLTERLARIELGKKRAEQLMAKNGLAPDPFKKITVPTIDSIIKFYIDNGCPTRNETPRTGRQLAEELRRVNDLRPFWKNKLANQITLEDCRDYRIWRVPRIKKKECSGLRTVDLELCTLSAIFTWALKNPKKTGVTYNPIAVGRTKYQKPQLVAHCRDHQPENGDELHALARMLFQDYKSEVLGWQLLIEAMVGQRSHEVLKLRYDATTRNDPGFIQDGYLYLYRSKTSKGTYPFIQIHNALAQCLMAYTNWRAIRKISSPWWFPSPLVKGAAVLPGALTKALRRICPAMGLPKRTSHGLRSYFVNVLRSQEPPLPDGEIALRIGQKTGGHLIVNVYGEKLPYKIDWLPAPVKDDKGTEHPGEPAWQMWLEKGTQ